MVIIGSHRNNYDKFPEVEVIESMHIRYDDQGVRYEEGGSVPSKSMLFCARGSFDYEFSATFNMFLLSLGLFVDVGNNYSVLDHYNVSFIYEDVDDKTTSGGTAPELVRQKVSFLWCSSLKQEICWVVA